MTQCSPAGHRETVQMVTELQKEPANPIKVEVVLYNRAKTIFKSCFFNLPHVECLLVHYMMSLTYT